MGASCTNLGRPTAPSRMSPPPSPSSTRGRLHLWSAETCRRFPFLRPVHSPRQRTRPLREDGYEREDGYSRVSPPFPGLEGRPYIARGEPRFAAEPRVHARRQDVGRAQDIDTHRRSPSPKQPAARLARTRQCGTPRISVSEHAGLPPHLRLDRCARRDTCTQGPRRSAATLGSVTVVPSGRKNRTRSKSQRDGPNEARGEPRFAA